MKIKMTIDECLEFADEWARGCTFHEGSQGWRVVCMLLAEEVRKLRGAQNTETLPQDWKGVDGAIAFHLIDRHADGWADTGRMMGEWLDANKAANVQLDGPATEGSELASAACKRSPRSDGSASLPTCHED